MDIKDKIITILNSISDIKTIIYDSGFSANVRIDRKETPAALLYLIKDWQLDISNGLQKEIANIQVFFFDRAKFDTKGEEKDVIVDSMSLIAKEFLSKLLADKTIEVEGDTIQMRSVFGQFDAFCVGVNVELRIKEKQGQCL